MIRKIQSVFSRTKNAEIRERQDAAGIDERASVEQKIRSIMAKVFKINSNDINAETSADTIDRWNSLAHVDLLVNLQKEFDIEFTDSQLVEMLNYNTIVQNVTAAMTVKSKIK